MRFAFEAAAPLVECEEKIVMSIPAVSITFFSQWPIVAAVIGLCGFRTEINNEFVFLRVFVLSS